MNKEPENPIPWIFIGVLGALVGVAGTAVFLALTDGIVEPGSFLSFDYWLEGKNGTSRSDVGRNLGLLGVAFLGVIFVGLRWLNLNRQAATAEKQADIASEQRALAERRHITDLINKAVENLGHQTVAVKLGGVHALWRLIEEIPGQDENAQRSDVKMILDILTSFVRHDAKGRVTQGEDGNLVLRVDVETAVQLLGDKNAFYRSIMPENHQLNLRGANLSGARLDDCDFHNANFFAANLSGAVLIGTIFSSAYLISAKFNDAFMYDTVLTSANLTAVDFTGAIHMTEEQVESAFWDDDDPPIPPAEIILPTQNLWEEEEE